MKRTLSLLLALLLSQALVAAARAQAPVTALDWLTVDLWLDYDRPQVLILLTGALPADAPRPATVTIPLPPQATVNAVARISAENQMIDDIEYSVEGDFLSLVTPDARFRVEYYVPYSGDSLQRQFSFRWQSPLDVQEMDLSVQQPQAATALTVEPAPQSVIEGSDGLQYHNLPLRELPAGEVYAVDVQYTMGSDTLTAAAGPVAGGEVPASPVAAGDGLSWNWPLVLAAAGLALVLLAVAWQLFVVRAAAGRATPPKPRPRRPTQVQDAPANPGSTGYCHQCGQRAQSGDRFCRACGTQLKQG